jgi:hypothetical protein
MTHDELRALARQIVADRLRASSGVEGAPMTAPVMTWSDHSSHAVYVRIVNSGDACVIEPDVECTHCNYCKSHGH